MKPSSTANITVRSALALASIFLLSFWPAQSSATPPEYVTFGREQSTDHRPDPAKLLRIWMVYVGQGDGLLIQLPTAYNYDPDPNDNSPRLSERVDVAIDGGGSPRSDARRFGAFLEQVYPGSTPRIEYAIITHHDMDHVVGLTTLIKKGAASFDYIFHNGLATYRPGRRGFPASGGGPGIIHSSGRYMAKVTGGTGPSAGRLDERFVIHNLEELRSAVANDEFKGVYAELAGAVIERADDGKVIGFDQARIGNPFISERECELRPRAVPIGFEVLWPPEHLSEYGNRDWGETINGNSVTFRLSYGDFAMLFTGDHNELSEAALLQHLKSTSKLDRLDCDVFKVPHHGSSHALEDFFKHPNLKPVLSVASMGSQGFQSKAMKPRAWQHPWTEVIHWLGGPHRVYCTFIKERQFDYAEITTQAERNELIEQSHILIETDGEWFRLVEVPLNFALNSIPSVGQTKRSDGTRWIRASSSR